MITERLLQGDRRALARTISLIENRDPGKNEIMKKLYTHAGKAKVIGITGSPGSGKSTLVDKLVKIIRGENFTVGVIAVDPSSPFTGGAILGDRIRMQEHTLDPGVFIRSMGTRGALGGLSEAAREAVTALDAFGKDVIILETVGVGQSEVDIVKYADTTVLLLTPAGGDSVQTIKAGVMEIADIFVVNKDDLPGADRTCAELASMLDLAPGEGWRPPVVRTVSVNGEGIDRLWEAIENHRLYLMETGVFLQVRRERVYRDFADRVENLVKGQVWEKIKEEISMDKALDELLNRRKDPYTLARDLLERIGFEG